MIAANIMNNQNVDGTFSQMASFGVSQSSLTGEVSYNINSMIWSNLKQFSLSASKTTILFNHDKRIPVKIQGVEIGGYYIKGSIYKISGQSITLMSMFGTEVVSLGVNDVFLLKKGLVAGYAFGLTSIFIGRDVMISPSSTFFITKPFPIKRIVVSPMVATSLSPISYTAIPNKFTITKYFTYIVGSNFDFPLTQRFKANLGGNIIGNTNPESKITFGVTIGSKIQL